MAIDAIRAGKDVYVEKPMTLSLADAHRLWRIERHCDRIVQVGTQYVTEAKYHEAARLIREGVIGKPISSQTSYCRNSKDGEWLYHINPKVQPGEQLDWDAWLGNLGPASFDTEVFHRWRRYRAYSTGIIGDLLVHMTTPLLAALNVGWPVRVTATGGHYIDKAMENHDQVNLTIQFEHEHTLTIAGSTCNAHGLEPMIRGHKGSIYLSGNRCLMRPESIFVDEVDEHDFRYQGENTQGRHRLNFLKAVRTRKPEDNLSSVELGVQMMVIVDLASRSMWEGAAFGYSPASMTAYRI
jgi:predicted dehydrogenase